MFNKFILFVCGIVCMAQISYAQRPCATDEHYQRLLLQYPQLAEYEAQYNKQIRDAIAARTTSATDTTIYDIPLVIHVIHDYGVENIPDDTLYQAAAIWAQVYMKQNADTAGVIPIFAGNIPNSNVRYIGNPRIRLHLATIDPNGNPTKGIVRFNSYLTQNGDDQAKFGDWPSTKYVNVWFINAFGNADAGAAAYAYLPPTISYIGADYDGVICLASYANFLQGGSDDDKTVPHEIGHVLNLEHPWGNTNQPAVACGDDGVDDTPPTMGHNPVGCAASALYDAACAAGYSKTYTSHDGTMDSVVNYPDTVNAQNIMDYTYCQRMFTYGQVVRMRTALLSSTAGRNNLFSPSNLASTGALAPMPDLAPIADFVVNRGVSTAALTDARTYFLTVNNTAQFKFQNWSWNDTVSSVAWTFSNGATNPTSTSMTTTTNSFSQPGWVTVSLTANSNAGSNTITNTQAVYAADTAAVGGMGYEQEFTSASAISNWPMFNYYNNQFKWQFYSGTGYDDGSCVRYRSFDTSTKRTGQPVGDHDDFYTPAFDLSNTTVGNFNFFTSGASVSSSGVPYGETAKNDSMEVDVSISGGQRWTRLAIYSGAALANIGVVSTEYVPTAASQWVARTVAIPSAYLTTQTFFRFRYYPGNLGNDLYLDKVSLSQFPAGVKEVLNSSTDLFNLFPNPASNGFNIAFKTGNDGEVSYTIKDITGKLVYEHKATLDPNSMQQESVSRSAVPSAGMYFVTVTIDGVSKTQKLVVY